MANALKRAAPRFYFMLLSPAELKSHFYSNIIFMNQRSTRQNMAAGWTEKISRSTREKLQCNVFTLLHNSYFFQNVNMILGSVLVRNCVPTFVVYTTLVMSNVSPNGCSAAITFSNHCSSLPFTDIIVHA